MCAEVSPCAPCSAIAMQGTNRFLPRPFPAHKIPEEPAVRRVVFLDGAKIHRVFEVGVSQHVAGNGKGVAEVNGEGGGHPRRDRGRVSWAVAVVGHGELPPRDVSKRRRIDSVVELCVVAERRRLPVGGEVGGPKL